MNFLFVFSRLHPNYYASIEALAEKHNVKCLVGRIESQTDNNEIDIHQYRESIFSKLLWQITKNSLPRSKFEFRYKHSSLFMALITLVDYKADILVIRKNCKINFIYYTLAAKLLGVKVIQYTDTFLDSQTNPISRFGIIKIYPVNWGFAKKNTKKYHIPLTIKSSHFQKKEYKKDGVLKIIHVGKFIKRKGQFLLLKALKLIKDKIPLEIHFYGDYGFHNDDDYQQQISHFIQNNSLKEKIIFHKNISPNKMYLEYRKYDLFVYSGYVNKEKYSFSTTNNIAPDGEAGTKLYSLIEAMNESLPVIVASEKNVSGIVSDGKDGFVFENFSEQDLAQKIHQAYYSDLATMGRYAKNKISHRNNPSTFVAKITNIVENNFN